MHGKHAVIVGASNIVGRPMSLELLFGRRNRHSDAPIHQSIWSSHVRQADVLSRSSG